MTLRIDKHFNGEARTLALSGRLDAMGLVELQRLIDEPDADQRFVLDLADLRSIDRSAISFLSFCEANGLQVKNCPAYVRDWLSREKRPGNNGNGQN